MKKLLFIVLSFLSLNALALEIRQLQVGDVLLLSLNCYECRMIESETDSLFSHSGVVIVDEYGVLRVGQALGSLHAATYADFIRNKTKGTYVHVYRPKEFLNLTVEQVDFMEGIMLDVFNERFKNAPFDSRFIWDNYNSKGEELLYCSEFIAKFLDMFLTQKTVPFPISYDKNLEYWTKLFKGDVPHGELGNSPASFSRDERFEFIGVL